MQADEFKTAGQVIACLHGLGNPEQARHLMRFFKTAPGQYGHGDQFLGIKVPITRAVATRCDELPLSDIEVLIESAWHEVRLCALLVLVKRFERLSQRKLINNDAAVAQRDEIVDFYLSHARCVNNWDLVDLSVYKILGKWLLLPSKYNDNEKLATLDRLAGSDNLWEQRMSIVCTMEPLRHGNAYFTLRYARWHLHHSHDLMHKAVGWLLREMGKRVGLATLREFLGEHKHEMPRTMLRYAIERMPKEERKQWMMK